MNHQTRQRVAAALKTIANSNDGRITPEEVVASAADENNPLHDQFTWDDAVAGHQHRLNQARKLIRSVRIERTVDHRVISVPVYARDPRVGRAQGSVRVADLRDDRAASVEALRTNVKRISTSVENCRALAEELDLVQYLEDLLATAGILIGEIEQLAAAA